MNQRPQVFENALQLIGNTPLIELKKLAKPGARLYAKAEFVQPGGSVKDRIAKRIIADAYATGKLQPGQPVVEMTSGNTGAGLAVVCNVYGNPLIITMSAGNSPERVRMIEGLGAEVRLVPQVDGAPGQVTGADIKAALDEALRIERETGAYFVDQFNNPSGVLAHQDGTGPEIWDALDGQLDAFVTSIGTGGTFIGTSRYLKSRDPNIRCIAAEPVGAEVLAGEAVTKPRHLLQGSGYGAVPPQWDATLADGFLAVTDEEATEYRRRLAKEEGLYVGFSSAANVCAAVKLIDSGQLGETPTVVTVLCDTGLKY